MLIGPLKIFLAKIRYGYHKTQNFNAEFESVGKNAKNYPKKVTGWKLFRTESQKLHFFCHFFVNSLFRIFCIFYDGFEISIKFYNSAFFVYILSIANFCKKKYFYGVLIALLVNFEVKFGRNGSNKRKHVFYKLVELTKLLKLLHPKYNRKCVEAAWDKD